MILNRRIVIMSILISMMMLIPAVMGNEIPGTGQNPIDPTLAIDPQTAAIAGLGFIGVALIVVFCCL
jgi:hypothetical protein